MKQNGILPARGLVVVPVLMLPTLLGAVWLALAPGAVSARVLVVAGTVAVAWYLLAGIFAGQRLFLELAVLRQVRAARRLLGDEPGCAWIVQDGKQYRFHGSSRLLRIDLERRAARRYR